MLFKSVDEKLKELGFVKTEENKYGATYRRDEVGVEYAHRLDILHKQSGKHLIQSYVETVNLDGFNDVVGLTYKETKLAMKKYRQLKRRYKW